MGGIGSGGHNRRSAASHTLTGTYRADRHGAKSTAGIARKAPRMPRDLDAAARRVWREIVPELERRGIITELDQMALVLYCTAVSDVQELSAIIDRAGMTFTTARGVVKARPEVAMLRRAMAQVLSMGRELGLTPLSRSRLPEAPLPEEDNPFLALMRPPAPREPAADG